jgi:hypothetical protein
LTTEQSTVFALLVWGAKLGHWLAMRRASARSTLQAGVLRRPHYDRWTGPGDINITKRERLGRVIHEYTQVV